MISRCAKVFRTMTASPLKDWQSFYAAKCIHCYLLPLVVS